MILSSACKFDICGFTIVSTLKRDVTLNWDHVVTQKLQSYFCSQMKTKFAILKPKCLKLQPYDEYLAICKSWWKSYKRFRKIAMRFLINRLCDFGKSPIWFRKTAYTIPTLSWELSNAFPNICEVWKITKTISTCDEVQVISNIAAIWNSWLIQPIMTSESKNIAIDGSYHMTACIFNYKLQRENFF